MNRKRIIILISALIVSALIVWHDLPLEFPGTMFKVVMLFVKLFMVLALASLAYVFAGGKKKSS
jgi:small-conductance mechanosensitive channel